MSESRCPLSSSATAGSIYLATLSIKYGGDELGCRHQLSRVARLEHDLDARACFAERRVRADEQSGKPLPRFDEHADDLALARDVRAPPRLDRRPLRQLG